MKHDTKPEIHIFKIHEHPKHIEIPIMDNKKIQADIQEVIKKELTDYFRGDEFKEFIRMECQLAIWDSVKNVEVKNAIVKNIEVKNYVKKDIPYEYYIPVEKKYTKWVEEQEKYTHHVPVEKKYEKWVAVEKEVEKPVIVEKEYEVPVPKVVQKPYPVKVPKVEYEQTVLPKYVLREQTVYVTHEKLKGSQ